MTPLPHQSLAPRPSLRKNETSEARTRLSVGDETPAVPPPQPLPPPLPPPPPLPEPPPPPREPLREGGFWGSVDQGPNFLASLSENPVARRSSATRPALPPTRLAASDARSAFEKEVEEEDEGRGDEGTREGEREQCRGRLVGQKDKSKVRRSRFNLRRSVVLRFLLKFCSVLTE